MSTGINVDPSGQTFIFDNDQVKRESQYYKTTDFQLQNEELQHFAKMATYVRAFMLSKAIEAAKEDDDINAIKCLEEKHADLKLDRGYTRG